MRAKGKALTTHEPATGPKYGFDSWVGVDATFDGVRSSEMDASICVINNCVREGNGRTLGNC